MEIKYHQNASERQAALAHVQERLRGRNQRQGFWRALMAGIVIGLMLIMRGGGYPGWLWLLACLALLWESGRIVAWARIGRNSGGPEGGYTLNIVPAGISRSLPDGHVEFYAWPEITALETTASHLYFHLGRGVVAVPLPPAGAEKALDGVTEPAPSPETEARRLWGAHPGNAGKTLPNLPPIPESPLYQAVANLGAAVRLAFFLKFDHRSFRVSWSALAILILAEGVWAALTDYIQAQPMPLFNLAGLEIYGVSLLLFLGWGVAVNKLMAQRTGVLRLLVMAESALLLISLVYFSVYLLLQQRMPENDGLQLAVFVAGLLWMVVALTRTVRRLYDHGISAALFLGGALVLFSMTLTSLYPDERIYVNAASAQPTHAASFSVHGKKKGARPTPPGSAAPHDEGENPADDEDDDDADDVPPPSAKLDVEDIYYRQPELIRHQLEGVKPRQPGETELYFIGFAGDASEHEFGNEVRYARKLLDRRFNTAGRSLLLINSYDTVKDTPLANAHNMDAVLQGLAGRMDRDNDVLFVFLSSHGAQDHRLGVSFYPLEMNDLRAEKLKEMLDKSGIRNRVIVVSACYSGGFLDVLKDDNTLVLTASRRDHVAYGCGDITEYTFFGDAYFVQALEHQDSFISAFDEARKRIAEREKNEGMDASGPQIYVGRNIEKALHRLKVIPAGMKEIKASPASGRPPVSEKR